jgi:hypothetical protein
VAVTAQMQRALLDLSAYYDVDPSAVFRRLLAAISDLYDGTMAVITLAEGERVRFRAISNPHPALGGLESLALQETY